MDETSLQERIREAIEAGELPNRLPDQLLGGQSSGRQCALCGESTRGGVEMELVFEEGTRSTRYHAHPRCLTVYEREVLDAQDDPAARLAKPRLTAH